MTRTRRYRPLAALLLLLGLVLPPAARGEPAQPASSVITPARPGSRAAATYDPRVRFVEPRLGGTFIRGASGVYVPDRRLELWTRKDFVDQGRWLGTRRAVLGYLARSGARPSPAPYQQLVQKIRNRAELTMRREGKSLGSWKMMVLEGGAADQVNAAAWTGGVITIYRPLVDLCYQIASVRVNSSTSAQIDTELWKLSRWRQDKQRHARPESLQVASGQLAKRDRIAESILSRVVLHEMGHAASGHLEIQDRQLIVPGKQQRRDLARSMSMEREADHFASVLGAKGAVAAPGLMPLFSYYNFISRPTYSERGKYAVADWRTHPLDAERYNNQHQVLDAANKTQPGMPLPLDQHRLVAADGRTYLTPARQADVVPIRPPVVQQPLRQAAALPR